MDTAKGIKEVNDFFGIMGMAYRFFLASTLRHQKLIEAQKKRGLKVLEIPHLSDTRWACRYLAVNLFKLRFGSVLDALDEIVQDVVSVIGSTSDVCSTTVAIHNNAGCHLNGHLHVFQLHLSPTRSYLAQNKFSICTFPDPQSTRGSGSALDYFIKTIIITITPYFHISITY